nr:MAG: uracil-DNA glycosylase family protein [Hyphomicrobiales bacterium]
MTARPKGAADLSRLLREIRACRICADVLPHAPRPVLRLKPGVRLCIVGQAPGLRVHKTGIPFNDPSGDRLRDWMGVSRDEFYDQNKIGIVPMGFCFPGYTDKGADMPPRRECAKAWRARLFEAAPDIPFFLVVGGYAQAYHLKGRTKRNVTETVRSWREYTPLVIPVPHPSWRNNFWLKKNPWFEQELLPYLKRRVRRVLRCAE